MIFNFGRGIFSCLQSEQHQNTPHILRIASQTAGKKIVARNHKKVMETQWKSLLNETNVAVHIRSVLLVPFGHQWADSTVTARKSMATTKNMFSCVTHAPKPSWTRTRHHLRRKSKLHVSKGLRMWACVRAGTRHSTRQQFSYAEHGGFVEKS